MYWSGNETWNQARGLKCLGKMIEKFQVGNFEKC